ncbi:MAG: methyl-accepting chemotaxis protein [Lachnospiraceae bacterium]|nr:methyl-accepting chemotaxis protein [Lachnospiraceae bacterium]
MQRKEGDSAEKGLRGKKEQDEGRFIGIGERISKRFGQVVMVCCIVLGAVTSVLSYISSISAVSETIDNTSDVAADYVSASLQQFVAIAYETGSIARLADAEKTAEEKAAILEQRIQDHNLDGGYLLDSNGVDVITGQNLSDREYFKEGMKGNTYISTPAYSEVTGKVSYVVAAPLWEGGIPGTTSVGVIAYVPNGEFLNDIMRSIQVGKGGTAFMLDRNGITIADVNSELVGVEDSVALGDTNPRLKKYSAICKKMIAGQNGTGTYSYNGKTKVVAYSPVPGTDGWSIGVAAVRNEFLKMFYISLALTVIFVVVFTVVGIKNGIAMGKAVAAPLGRAVDRLKLLAEGDIHSEVPEPAENDETKILLDCLSETIRDLNTVITGISSDLAEMADGNFMIDVEENYKGDFAQISDSFRDIVGSLGAAMGEIDTNAESVRKGATDLAGASQLLAEGATDQASAIEELTATMTDISEKIHTNAENAAKAKKVVLDMNGQVSESNAQMKQSTEAMERIREASDKIAEIISSIEEIASQTNLLALNASIEAARAGEAGKGFAVVATQVGTLSEQSSEAAKNTKQLIQNAIQAVEEGTKLANSTAESLLLVVENAMTVGQAIDEIAAASGEQADATAQITEGINQIAQVVESNSATSEESAAASQELSAQADLLKELVDRFKYHA